MNTKMLAKWFFDNNFLAREEEDKTRLRHLTFVAAATLGIDEEIELQEEMVEELETFENYKFEKETINLLNSINRSIGYNDIKLNTLMFKKVLNNHKQKSIINFKDIKKYYLDFRNRVLDRFDGYNFNKKVIKVGYNIYFLNFDEELTSEELKLFETDDLNQKVYEVYKENGEVMFL